MPSLADLEKLAYTAALGLSAAQAAVLSDADLATLYFQLITNGGGFKASTSPVRYSYNFSPTGLKKWRAAKSRVRLNLGDAKILCVGDSTTFGASNALTLTPNGAWPARLATLLNNQLGLLAAPGFATPPIAANLAADTFWTAGAGWPSSRTHGFGQSGWGALNPGGTLVYADSRATFDRYDVYYLHGPSLGSISATATGGSATPCTGSDFSLAKTTVSAAAAGTGNSISMTATGQIFFCGIEPWNSAISRIRVGNGGVSASATDQWIGDSPYGGPDGITTYAADLVIISLGTNDAVNGNSTSKYLTQLNTIIAAAVAVGSDVLLLSQPATSDVPTQQVAQDAGMAALGLPFLDDFNRLGAYAAVNSLGFMDDAHHKNNAGLWDEADFIAQALMAA